VLWMEEVRDMRVRKCVPKMEKGAGFWPAPFLNNMQS
jgi:hypothetical protein